MQRELPDPEQSASAILSRAGYVTGAVDFACILAQWPELKIAPEAIERDGYILDMGMLGVDIVVRAGEGRTRRRYTLAHEIGHWYLKIHAGIPIKSAETEDRISIERWCNRFAAFLLMPDATIKQFQEWEDISIEKIIRKAHELDVSARTLLWRVLEDAPYEGGALRFCMMGKPTNPQDIRLRLDWALFPKSPAYHVYKFGIVAFTSPIYKMLGEENEQIHADVKLEFGSLRGKRTLMLKSFNQSVLAIVVPEQVNYDQLRIDAATLQF